jgi:hypothetical protein
VARDIGVALGLRPVLHLGAEFGLRHRHAAGAVDLREAAGQHRLGLVVERAQELRLPAVPDARARRRGCRRWSGRAAASCARATARSRRSSRSSCGRTGRATARRRHHEMLLDQPGDGLGLGRRQPKRGQSRRAIRGRRRSNGPRAGPWRCRAGTARRRAARDARAGSAHHLVGERGCSSFAALDLGEHADAADQVLVHRVVVIHVELHHRDDAAESGTKRPSTPVSFMRRSTISGSFLAR